MQSFEQTFTEQKDEESLSDCDLTTSPITKTDTYLLETFHQHPNGDFRPTFYNPFEIKHRRRTTRTQLRILEKAFSENAKPNATIRRLLAQKLEMTPRGVQIWFQNRRAKAKLQRAKSNVQTHRQKHQQSRENLDQTEAQYISDSNSTKSMTSSENFTTSPGDISQSSVLFSQFFANVSDNQNVQELDPNSQMIEQPQKSLSTNNWNWQANEQAISDNARTVAAVAAATAVATSSAPYERNLITLGGETNWLAHDNNNAEKLFNQHSNRRKSCPVPNNTMLLTDMKLCHQQLSPSWSHSMAPRNKISGGSGNTSPMVLFNNYKRNFSIDSTSPSMDYYPMQDIHLNNYAHRQQLTPPLTASCSASTVAGSPISLDSIYNDPVVVSHNGFYSSASHISSPLSTTTLVTGIMPNFI